MARSLSSAKFLSALVLDGLSFSRRGYAAAAASQGAVSARSSGAPRMGKVVKKEESAENAWVPDPVTGYYRPANRANEIDVAELREILINQRIRSQEIRDVMAVIDEREEMISCAAPFSAAGGSTEDNLHR